MRISIFPGVLPHPANKTEKSKEASKANNPVTVTINTDDELIKVITENVWSPFIFNKKRAASDCISTDFLVYDIDEGLTIDEAEKILEKEKLCCICLPSPSHTPEAHRFRIILPLAQPIKNASVYEATWKKGAELFKTVDDQCKDLARLFFACRLTDGFAQEGRLFEPVNELLNEPKKTYIKDAMIPISDDIDQVISDLYGEKRHFVPESVDYFIKNAKTGLPGHWINTLNSTVFSLALSGVDEDLIWQFCQQYAPQELDSKDEYQIKKSIQDAKKAMEAYGPDFKNYKTSF